MKAFLIAALAAASAAPVAAGEISLPTLLGYTTTVDGYDDLDATGGHTYYGSPKARPGYTVDAPLLSSPYYDSPTFHFGNQDNVLRGVMDQASSRLTFVFGSDVNVFGLDFGDNLETAIDVKFDFFDASNALVDSITKTSAAATGQSTFLGFQTASLFKTVQLSFPTNYSQDSWVIFDNVRYGVASEAEDVPEPAMLGLFGLGALGLASVRRRRR